MAKTRMAILGFVGFNTQHQIMHTIVGDEVLKNQVQHLIPAGNHGEIIFIIEPAL
jgi:hypothetical protein